MQVSTALANAKPRRGGTSTVVSEKAKSRALSQISRNMIASPHAASNLEISDLLDIAEYIELEWSIRSAVFPPSFGVSARHRNMASSSASSRCGACLAAE